MHDTLYPQRPYFTQRGNTSRKGKFTLAIQIIFKFIFMQGASSMRSLEVKMK